jgi:dTDP-4-amino-4,6-dideoxygalactose transaminase
METLCGLSLSRGIPLVEDNAHGLFGRYGGKLLGTFGALAALSFHETKNFTCGEGGALLINDPAYVRRAEIIREKGTDRARFLKGEVDKYTWVDVGSSFVPSDILAAFLFAQLEAKELVLERRRRVWEAYRQGLSGWARDRGIQIPAIPPNCQPSHHVFYLIMPSQEDRREVILRLNENGILATFHYVPLHASAMGQRYGVRPESFPVATSVSQRLVRLPLYHDLAESDQSRIMEILLRM